MNLEATIDVDLGIPEGTPLTIDSALTANESDPESSNDSDPAQLLVETPLFSDGFESGSTGAWDSAVP